MTSGGASIPRRKPMRSYGCGRPSRTVMADRLSRGILWFDDPRDLPRPAYRRALEVPHGRAETAARGVCSYEGECDCGKSGVRANTRRCRGLSMPFSRPPQPTTRLGVADVQLPAPFGSTEVAVVSTLPFSIAGVATQRPGIFCTSIMNVSCSCVVSLASWMSSSSSLIAWPTTAAATLDFFGASSP
jgi:hypothetical protein